MAIRTINIENDVRIPRLADFSSTNVIKGIAALGVVLYLLQLAPEKSVQAAADDLQTLNNQPTTQLLSGSPDFKINFPLPKPVEIPVDIAQEDWNQKEAQTISEVVQKDFPFIAQIFGPTQKFITEVRVAKLTDELKKQWGFEDYHEGTSCDPSTGVCTIWIDQVPSTHAGEYSSSRTALTHGLVHAWIGGYYKDLPFGQNDGVGYMFEPIVNSSALTPGMAASPQNLFEEESLCFFLDDLVEKQVWNADIPPSHDLTRHYLYRALVIDPLFIQKMRDQLDISGHASDDLTMAQIIAMTKAANPQVATAFNWK